MGDVYRAYDQTLQRAVAIKVLRDGAEEGAARSRLLREARAAAALNHPNICTIHEVGEDNGQAFLAMELIPRFRAMSRRQSPKRSGFGSGLPIGSGSPHGPRSTPPPTSSTSAACTI